MAQFADVEDKISFFFDSPRTEVSVHRRGTLVSILYLLRRELIETAGYDPGVHDEATVDASGVRNRLFASLILMFTAFDLLAKFHLGDSGGVGARFKEFLQAEGGGQLDAPQAKLLYAIRNSLVHAFSVPGLDALQRLGMKGVSLGQRKEFSSAGGVTGLVTTSTHADTAIVYIDGVFRELQTAISNYRDSLYGSDAKDNRVRFEQMFDKYGSIHIG
jgi:hypothetical protein